MGFVYNAKHAVYLEVARVEALRHLGVSYKELEDSGILLPVHTLNFTFLKPACYDDLIEIKTIVPIMPAVKILFEYELRNQHGELLNTAKTTLAFIYKNTRRPCKGPKEVLEKFIPYFA